MDRVLQVTIDKATWPGPGIQPLFPKTFHSGQRSFDINIPAMLMMIGYLTTPTSSTGVSLSEFWAWVRYLAAISDESRLSLTRSFAELDAHQKTILSDDFGMGVPILWLCDRLSLVEIVDGRYFMQKISASVGVTQRRTAKRGPNKTPDFVARDIAGRWHVIECKGTQSGSEFSQKQLGHKGPPPTGGVAQKCAIQFPLGHSGQRLVCGLSIDVEGGTGSVLKIVDPEPDNPFEIDSKQIVLAEDAAVRGVMSKALRMSGFEVTAEALASPLGRRPDSRRAMSSKVENERRKFVDERESRSRDELRDRSVHKELFGGKFRGRQMEFELPRKLLINDEIVRRVIIRQGVNREALQELAYRPTVEHLIDEESAGWAQLIDRSVVKSDGPTATMDIGNVFRSEIILE